MKASTAGSRNWTRGLLEVFSDINNLQLHFFRGFVIGVFGSTWYNEHNSTMP